MKNVYIAGPMFSEAELQFNEKVALELEKNGLCVFLPQRSGYKMVDLMKKMPACEAGKIIFEKDYLEVKKADVLVVILDGRVIDEGACIELGMGYALGKKCYGLKTDPRTMINGQINPMISECLIKIYSSVFDLGAELCQRGAI